MIKKRKRAKSRSSWPTLSTRTPDKATSRLIPSKHIRIQMYKKTKHRTTSFLPSYISTAYLTYPPLHKQIRK